MAETFRKSGWTKKGKGLRNRDEPLSGVLLIYAFHFVLPLLLLTLSFPVPVYKPIQSSDILGYFPAFPRFII
jgi:hypothetical protein